VYRYLLLTPLFRQESRMVWYGYLFRSDIHFTHIVNILHQHVPQHFEFFPLNFSLHYLQTLIQVACLTFILNQSNAMHVQSQRTVGALAWRVKMRLGLPWQTVTMSSSKYRQNIYYQNRD
jgi:hypothetical protein